MLKKSKGFGHVLDVQNHVASLDIDLQGDERSEDLMAEIAQAKGANKAALEKRIIEHLTGDSSE